VAFAAPWQYLALKKMKSDAEQQAVLGRIIGVMKGEP